MGARSGVLAQGNSAWHAKRIVRVAPDAQFSLGDARHERHFFLEIDRSTEEHRRLVQKYLSYWWYLQSPDFHRVHPSGRRVNVLFVTTGHSRLINALRRMPKPNRATHGGKGIFWFALETAYALSEPSELAQCDLVQPHNA